MTAALMSMMTMKTKKKRRRMIMRETLIPRIIIRILVIVHVTLPLKSMEPRRNLRNSRLRLPRI